MFIKNIFAWSTSSHKRTHRPYQWFCFSHFWIWQHSETCYTKDVLPTIIGRIKRADQVWNIRHLPSSAGKASELCFWIELTWRGLYSISQIPHPTARSHIKSPVQNIRKGWVDISFLMIHAGACLAIKISTPTNNFLLTGFHMNELRSAFWIQIWTQWPDDIF